jgi:hypothetical protein
VASDTIAEDVVMEYHVVQGTGNAPPRCYLDPDQHSRRYVGRYLFVTRRWWWLVIAYWSSHDGPATFPAQDENYACGYSRTDGGSIGGGIIRRVCDGIIRESRSAGDWRGWWKQLSKGRDSCMIASWVGGGTSVNTWQSNILYEMSQTRDERKLSER